MPNVDKTGLDRLPSGRWRARYRDGEGRTHTKTFDRSTEAASWRKARGGEVVKGEHIAPNRITVGEYARQWIAARPHRPSTATRVESLVRVHIEGTRLGDRRVQDVRATELRTWITERGKSLAPGTARLLLSLVRSIFAGAVEDEIITKSPAATIKSPKRDRVRFVPLTVDQVRALTAAMPERNRAMVLTQAGLGLRIGELLALRSEDVDFLRREVHVRTQIAPGAKVRSEPKTDTSVRTIPLPTMVAEALAEHMRTYPPTADGSLFYTRTAAVYRHDYYGSVIFKAAVRAAGLPGSTSTHALRHHYASILLAAGESVVVVAERLGHENAKLVLTTYGHLMPDTEDSTRKAVDSAWATDGVISEAR